jgi:diaminopimelate epimerase
MGNPHAVIQTEELEQAAVKEIGSALGSHPDFPEGVNVGFMQVVDRQHIKLVVHERGTGITLACGTGACAAVVAGQRLGLLDTTVTAELPGGSLKIHWDGNSKGPQLAAVTMTGPVSTVYKGEIQL